MQNGIRIGAKVIGESVFIIAEAGVNHNGNLKRALQMVDEAARAGADAVKFQAFEAEKLVSNRAPKADYQRQRSRDRTQLEMLKALELSEDDFKAIAARARKRAITFLSTPFDEGKVDLLDNLGVPAFKISSGDITNIPLLNYVAAKGKPILLSTGMSTLEEVQQSVSTIRNQGNDQIILLHCVSLYPSEASDSNLRAMQVLKEHFKTPVGFSDHTTGIEVSLAAVAVGAAVIEKHFTLSRKLPGPDHRASLEVAEFQRMVRGIRLVEQALGKPVKEPTEGELKMRPIARRSIVASMDIPKGSMITRDMIAIKRPGTGISPAELQTVLGKSAKWTIRRDEVITWNMLE